MKETTNLKLRKPERVTYINVDDLNYNFDKLDEEVTGKIDANGKTVAGELNTTEKSNLVTAINQCFQFANDGKSAVADAINNKGVNAAPSESFPSLADKITVNLVKKQGNAVASDTLQGKTFINNTGELITGTIPSKAAATITPGTSNQTIAAGQYLSGTQTIAGDADLVSGNIKKGVNIFGVIGSYESVRKKSKGRVSSITNIGHYNILANNQELGMEFNCGNRLVYSKVSDLFISASDSFYSQSGIVYAFKISDSGMPVHVYNDRYISNCQDVIGNLTSGPFDGLQKVIFRDDKYLKITRKGKSYIISSSGIQRLDTSLNLTPAWPIHLLTDFFVGTSDDTFSYYFDIDKTKKYKDYNIPNELLGNLITNPSRTSAIYEHGWLIDYGYSNSNSTTLWLYSIFHQKDFGVMPRGIICFIDDVTIVTENETEVVVKRFDGANLIDVCRCANSYNETSGYGYCFELYDNYQLGKYIKDYNLIIVPNRGTYYYHIYEYDSTLGTITPRMDLVSTLMKHVGYGIDSAYVDNILCLSTKSGIGIFAMNV